MTGKTASLLTWQIVSVPHPSVTGEHDMFCIFLSQIKKYIHVGRSNIIWPTNCIVQWVWCTM
jgi:hypothetical protein